MAKRSENSLLEWALYYFGLGWSIIPIGRNKKPPRGIVWKKYQTTRADESKLHEWFGEGKYRNLAVVCGAISGGLTVLDFDSMRSHEWWKGQYPEDAARLPTVRTSRGIHKFFRSELTKSKKYSKMDLKASGYVILPPSIHPDGSIYEWLIPLQAEQLPKLNPLEWKLEKFTEDTEEPEDTEDAKGHRSHKGGKKKEDFLAYLGDETRKEVEKAIAATLPKEQGQRNDAVFPLCQWLKAIPELRDRPAKDLKPIVKEWHKRAYPVIKTKPFVDTWADFIHAWKRVKWPQGDVMLQYAVKRALEKRADLPEANEYDSEEARLLLRVCYELQQAVGNRPFFLASRIGAGILGVSHRTVLKLLEMFVVDEKLELVEEHTTNKAPRYRYIRN